MKNFFALLLIGYIFFSLCTRDESKLLYTTDEVDTISLNEDFIESDETQFSPDYYRNLLILEKCEGYYRIEGDIFGIVRNTMYLVSVVIIEHELVISRVNIIDEQSVNEELMRFNIELNEKGGSISFENGNYRFSARVDSANNIYRSLYKHYPDDTWTRSDFYPILSEFFKYTYDYQKQYTGVYLFDSITVNGITEEDIPSSHLIYDPFFITIDYNGNLFISNDEYGDSRIGWSGTVILDENSDTKFFGHSPGDGAFTVSYIYRDNTIYYSFEQKYNRRNATDEEAYIKEQYSYQVIYKKQQ